MSSRRGLLLAALLAVATGPWPARAAEATAAAAQALLPAAARAKGVLTAAMPLDYEPYNYLDEKSEQVGYDVEIFKALAQVLGLKPEIQRLGFAAVIPAVSGGRVDVGMSVMGILEARRKQVSFVRYTLQGQGLIVRAGNPSGITTETPCGHSVVVEKGTNSMAIWPDIAKRCEAAGKPAINLMTVDGKGPQVLAVETGRAEAAGVSFATAHVAAAHSQGKLDAAPGGPVPGGSVDAGIAFRKDNIALGRALEVALQVLVANGTYARIGETWELGAMRAEPAIFE